MDNKRPTIIDFVEKYTSVYADKTFLREKVDGKWTETSFRKTRNEGRIAYSRPDSCPWGCRKGRRWP